MKDRGLDRAVAAVLRAGVTASLAVLIAGGAWMLLAGTAARPDYSVFVRRSWSFEALAGLLRPDADALIRAGLLALILTPAARVAVSAAWFARRRDWKYLLMTLVVLAVLLQGFFIL